MYFIKFISIIFIHLIYLFHIYLIFIYFAFHFIIFNFSSYSFSIIFIFDQKIIVIVHFSLYLFLSYFLFYFILFYFILFYFFRVLSATDPEGTRPISILKIAKIKEEHLSIIKMERQSKAYKNVSNYYC